VWHELRDGFRWLRRDTTIRTLVLAGGVVSMADAAWFAVLVLYVVRVLRQPTATYGLLLAAGAIGGVVAGVASARVVRLVGPQVAVIGTVVVLAATQLGLGLTTNVIVAAVLLTGSSAAFAVFNVVAVTLRQRLVPAELLGRVSSVYRTVGRAAEGIGALAGGVIATVAGIRAPMLLGAIPLVAVGALLVWHQRRYGSNKILPS
jgi:predicted MFS family arabinose efflux permease